MTYEYLCSACGNEWEATQSISEPALTECPKCHKHTAKRQVSGGSGFVLKGGGWYSDLYSSAKPSAPSKDGEGTSKESSEPAAKAKTADAKPAAKSSEAPSTKTSPGE